MTDDERAIRQLIDTWLDASKAGDTETVLSLMTDDVIFMVPGQKPFGKAAFMAASAGQKNIAIDGNSEILELQVLGDWAFLRSRLAISITPKDGSAPPMHLAGNTMTILRKEADGRWLLARDANLLVPQPAQHAQTPQTPQM
ncbi:SgcJ/EcaC family oxidoreductase [Paraburkholderia phymatum]|uniref:DUF4440 domain-containing protein n=1 Tax=Paraburkholderia phymatum (strain DSM 17167 / CIP 108236 / LMG 21445 / STM815) TaxID=391038 RepID=B2JCM5_PARP8|nr:SgcJ/EcaC family oxidoreductase [Paraburkholderia phymatum]ACC71026.1 conserved hypothetical protein [Paraburkholderia phymatum STM815]